MPSNCTDYIFDIQLCIEITQVPFSVFKETTPTLRDNKWRGAEESTEWFCPLYNNADAYLTAPRGSVYIPEPWNLPSCTSLSKTDVGHSRERLYQGYDSLPLLGPLLFSLSPV